MADAMWALIGVAVGAGITGLVNWIQQTRQFAHDREMFTLKNKSADMVKAILAEMLNHRRYVERSFEALKKSVGGYPDEAIRQFLHEIGARRTERDDGAEEWWYLTSRQQERAARSGRGRPRNCLSLKVRSRKARRVDVSASCATPSCFTFPVGRLVRVEFRRPTIPAETLSLYFTELHDCVLRSQNSTGAHRACGIVFRCRM